MLNSKEVLEVITQMAFNTATQFFNSHDFTTVQDFLNEVWTFRDDNDTIKQLEILEKEFPTQQIFKFPISGFDKSTRDRLRTIFNQTSMGLVNSSPFEEFHFVAISQSQRLKSKKEVSHLYYLNNR